MTAATDVDHAEHLRALAASFTEAAQHFAEPGRSALIDTAGELEEIADALQTAQEAPGAPERELCDRPARRGRFSPCDRPKGHEGECSWEAARIRRLASEHEHEARKVPHLESQLRAATLKLTEADTELRTLRLWREAWRNREALGRARRRRRAEERG